MPRKGTSIRDERFSKLSWELLTAGDSPTPYPVRNLSDKGGGGLILMGADTWNLEASAYAIAKIEIFLIPLLCRRNFSNIIAKITATSRVSCLFVHFMHVE